MGEERAHRMQEIDKLYMEVHEFRTKENFTGLVNFVKRFPHMAPYNAMLVYVQKPGSRFVATPDEWRIYGRQPKKGARPLVILQMFGPVGFVYELEDTEEIPGRKGIFSPKGCCIHSGRKEMGSFIFISLRTICGGRASGTGRKTMVLPRPAPFTGMMTAGPLYFLLKHQRSKKRWCPMTLIWW